VRLRKVEARRVIEDIGVDVVLGVWGLGGAGVEAR